MITSITRASSVLRGQIKSEELILLGSGEGRGRKEWKGGKGQRTKSLYDVSKSSAMNSNVCAQQGPRLEGGEFG